MALMRWADTDVAKATKHIAGPTWSDLAKEVGGLIGETWR
jgi:hypothetical protein